MGATYYKDQKKDDEDVPLFKPMDQTFREVYDAVPAHCHERYTSWGLYYLARDIACVAVFWYLGMKIDPVFSYARSEGMLSLMVARLGRWGSWCLFWYFQSLAFTALWVLGHECNHRAFSPSKIVCDVVGYLCHSFTGTPYFSWKITHHIHHSYNGSFERDCHHVPMTRSELNLPTEQKQKDGHGHETLNYEEYLGDTPLYTVLMLIVHQFIGFPLYILYNLGGQRRYPSWTSHYNPQAMSLFRKKDFAVVIASDIGILSVILACWYASTIYGFMAVWKFYIVPWLGVNNWIMTIVYLQHTDPTVPHYRSGVWTYSRGAACTIDRDLLGFLGRFFFHDVAHYHVAHHYFPRMPFYHGEEATKHIKAVIGKHYLKREDYYLPVLWRNFNDCQFVEDEGQILFYKNKQGKSLMRVEE